jgi:hypothetical protein
MPTLGFFLHCYGNGMMFKFTTTYVSFMELLYLTLWVLHNWESKLEVDLLGVRLSFNEIFEFVVEDYAMLQ